MTKKITGSQRSAPKPVPRHAWSQKQDYPKVVEKDSGGGTPDLPAGSLSGIEDLYRLYASYVAFIAHRLVGVAADVDDIVQDVFIDAERSLSKLRELNSVKGWLATITVRRARRHLRKRRVKQIIGVDRSRSYEDLVDSSASPEQCAMISSIYRILDSFSADYRIAWTLKYVHGEKVNQVARLCGCSRATVHRRIALVQSVIQEAMNE